MFARATEIDTQQAFDDRVHSGDRRALRGCVVQGVDLRADDLRSLSVRGAVFLGCSVDDDTADDLRARGALLFPDIPHLPFDPYRSALYSPDDLFDAPRYADSFDARVYAWSRHPRTRRDPASSIGIALHDHAVEAALDTEMASTSHTDVVGIMGGHALHRDTAEYRAAAMLARALTRAGRTILTGGGPGAMEAANLGAYLADSPDEALDQALHALSAAPTFTSSLDAWADAAARVRRQFPNGARSIGIPTWFYGHEPPNAFATAIAKFFANPLREATLLERCGGGIIFLPGSAGTVSEIFIDACENYYASDEAVAPMVLVGIEQWTKTLPAWPLLEALGRDRTMGQRLRLVPDIDAAFAAVSEA